MPGQPLRRLSAPLVLLALLLVGGALKTAPWPSAADAAGLYVCRMHPQLEATAPGRCPICGMDLVPKADAGERGAEVEAHEHGPSDHDHRDQAHSDQAHGGQAAYVCPMHPQVVAAQPGRCPICGMDLVTKVAELGPADPPTGSGPVVALAPGMINRLGVRTARVERGRLERRLDAFGAYFEVTAQGFRGTVQSTDPGARQLVLAQVFEGEAPLVRVGQATEVRFTGRGPRIWKGRVESVDPQVNQGTHTLQFRVAVEVEPGTVIPGTSARVRLAVDPVEDVLLIPREALIVTARAGRVVLDLGDGRFAVREVEAEDLGEPQVIIRSGLAEGDAVVVSGQFLLDSEASLQAGLRRLEGVQEPAGPGASGEAR